MSKHFKTSALVVLWGLLLCGFYVSGAMLKRSICNGSNSQPDSTPKAMTAKESKGALVSESSLKAGTDPSNTSEPASIAREIQALYLKPPSVGGTQRLRELWFRLGSLQGVEGVRQALQLAEGKADALNSALCGWASANPNEAWAWAMAEGGGKPGGTGMVKGGILLNLAKEITSQGDYRLCSALFTGVEPGMDKTRILSMYAAAVARYAPDNLDRLLTGLDTKSQADTIAAISSEWAASDPIGTMNWLFAHPSESTNGALGEVLAQMIASSSQSEARNWLLGQPASSTLDAALDQFLAEPDVAAQGPSEEILNRFSDPKARTAAIEHSIYSIQSVNPAVALEWVGRLSTEMQPDFVNTVYKSVRKNSPTKADELVSRLTYLSETQKQKILHRP